ncbi:MAG: acyl transferase [Bernardetiaceae bacterium]
MTFLESFKSRVLSGEPLSDLALEAFAYQATHNPVYRLYLTLIGCAIEQVQHLSQIPFLPIACFKNFPVQTGRPDFVHYFESSRTTGQQPSKHYLKDLDWYAKVSRLAFEQKYGNLSDYEILALLPAYLEQQRSSLVYMVRQFMQHAGSASGFYLYDHQALTQKIETLRDSPRKLLLLGVTFALLDFAKAHRATLPLQTIVMETGGMKGRGEELPREAVHEQLCDAFGVSQVHSEYGMTELLSQAYADRAGVFVPPPWMHVRLRDLNDPFSLAPIGSVGGIDVIDLANIESCCFIQTQDLGRYVAGGFEVLGRFDHSEVRGCNLLYVG